MSDPIIVDVPNGLYTRLHRHSRDAFHYGVSQGTGESMDKDQLALVQALELAVCVKPGYHRVVLSAGAAKRLLDPAAGIPQLVQDWQRFSKLPGKFRNGAEHLMRVLADALYGTPESHR